MLAAQTTCFGVCLRSDERQTLFSFSSPDAWVLRQAGLNMIRLWGGAAVARDAFYDACDEAGILVRRKCGKAWILL